MADKKRELTCVINIDWRRNRRRLCTVSLSLSAAGIQHGIRLGPIQYFHKDPIQKLALSLPDAAVTWSKGQAADLTFTDDAELVEQRTARGLKSVLINLLGAAPPKPGRYRQQLFLPIFFHPLLMNHQAYEKASRLAQNAKRPIHFLSAGNCDPQAYSRAQPASIHNRSELMAAAKGIDPQNIVFPETAAELDALLTRQDAERRLVWINTNRMKIAQSQWLELLSSARYFLCAPGVFYPYCHNLNEAMACGAVPVLQFADFYLPALVHEQECIRFSHADELEGMVATLANKPDAAWRAQSAKAVAYHEQHLSLNAFSARLSAFLEGDDLVLDWQSAGKN